MSIGTSDPFTVTWDIEDKKKVRGIENKNAKKERKVRKMSMKNCEEK